MAENPVDNQNTEEPHLPEQQYATLRDLRNANEDSLPAMCFAYCMEDGRVYLYRRTNKVDRVTGRFRDYLKDASIQRAVLPPAGSLEYQHIYQYIGNNEENRRYGFFYTCSRQEGIYFWEPIQVSFIPEIPESFIDALFA